MAGTIVTDRIESDASYASSVSIASPLVIANTISMANGSFTSNVNFSSNTLSINSSGLGRVGIGIVPSNTKFEITANSTQIDLMQFNETSAGYVRSWRIGPGTGIIGRFVVRDVTGGTNPFSIDTSGNVFHPSQTSFQAYKSAGNQDVLTSAATKITYQTTNWNTGNGFNTANSRFTAPVGGKYLFVVNHNPFSIDSGNFSMIMISKNGADQVYGSRNYSDSGFDQTYSTSFIMDLNASDYVEVFSQSNDTSYGLSGGQVWNSFSGHFLG
jgi:hypothetical protein